MECVCLSLYVCVCVCRYVFNMSMLVYQWWWWEILMRRTDTLLWSEFRCIFDDKAAGSLNLFDQLAQCDTWTQIIVDYNNFDSIFDQWPNDVRANGFVQLLPIATVDKYMDRCIWRSYKMIKWQSNMKSKAPLSLHSQCRCTFSYSIRAPSSIVCRANAANEHSHNDKWTYRQQSQGKSALFYEKR